MKPSIVIDIKNAEENKILKRIINTEGIINLDLKDIQTVLGEKALYGFGEATGNIEKATRNAIASILSSDKNAFEVDGAVINIATEKEFPLLKTHQECFAVVESFLKPGSNLLWGLCMDDDTLNKDQILVEILLPGV